MDLKETDEKLVFVMQITNLTTNKVVCEQVLSHAEDVILLINYRRCKLGVLCHVKMLK